MSPDGWDDDNVPTSQEERNLQRFLDDLRRKCDEAIQHSEAMRQTWKEALKDKGNWRGPLAAPVRCPACMGTTIVKEISDGPDLFGGVHIWSHSCDWCMGTGVVQLISERRGIP